MKMKYFRWVVLAAVFAIITIGLVLNTNLGTLSSFGWQAIATICPLGAIESMLASRSIFLRALIVLVVIIALVVVFGKFFCSWVCPVAPIRSLREIVRKKLKRDGNSTAKDAEGKTEGLVAAETDTTAETSPAANKSAGSMAAETVILAENSEASSHGTAGLTAAEKEAIGASACSSGCTSCASACPSKRPKIDSRHVVLGGSLLSAAIFGFPVFCLLCPIGLIFGTVIVVWQFFGFGDLSLSLLIYPVILILELLVFRKWCAKLCPMGAMLSLISLSNRFFKPVVDRKKCIRARGGNCTICSDVCPEQIDPHCADGMNECSKCGLCKDACPTGAISFSPFPKRDAYDDTALPPLEQESEASLTAAK